MDSSSSVIVHQEASRIKDFILVNGCQSPNDALPTAIHGGGCFSVVCDGSDDLFSGSTNSKRKYESEDDSVPTVAKSRRFQTPMLVEPIRSVRASELGNSSPPGSVKVENVEPIAALPISMYPMENLGEKVNGAVDPPIKTSRQFWKAGDYEGNSSSDDDAISSSIGMDHVRVHPKFLHSNATSHKWALGAFAELLDNALDEVCNGATYVHIDMLKNKRDGNKMLLIEDNGGGMCPDQMRRCMSLGYSSKRNMPNTIGQYGNGFKTSTMRIGADVLVFSRCKGTHQRGPTQSIGMLSYTFLRDTGKEDIVVPMIDFEFKEDRWSKIMRSEDDWNRNLNIIAQWSPYSAEELLQQFNLIEDKGTRIIIYNLWEDDEGQLELDFDTDSHDIQIRGVNRDEKNIKMAQQYPNCRHFLTYRHSLRIYASILYLRLPAGFRIILRGKDVEYHSIVGDLMSTKEITYRPHQLPTTVQNPSDMSVTVTIGFVKDARSHIDVQGFNVYHKNRLIKPFWRIWNPAGSDGRGVIGVLEANFVEPAHDKQGFERTIVLSRLESRLVQIQKDYWTKNCQEIGYAARRRSVESNNYSLGKLKPRPNRNTNNGINSSSTMPSMNYEKITSSPSPLPSQSPFPSQLPLSLPSSLPPVIANVSAQAMYTTCNTSTGQPGPPVVHADTVKHSNGMLIVKKEATNLMNGAELRREIRDRLSDPCIARLMTCLFNENEKCKVLENEVDIVNKQLYEVTQKLEQKEKENMLQIDFSSAEIIRKDQEISNLNERLWDATTTIRTLQVRLNQLESSTNTNSIPKIEANDLSQTFTDSQKNL